VETIRIESLKNRNIRDVIKIEIECGLSRWSHTDYVDELARPDSVMLMASVADHDCAGFLVGRVIPGKTANANDAEIYNIGVRTSLQGKGIGSRLMNELFSICSRDRIENIWLDVRQSNEQAISFYRSFGFTQTAVRRAFYRDPAEDGIIMAVRISEHFLLQDRNIA
jgi:ribosomal-protein-alanine N-acetyltransferase